MQWYRVIIPKMVHCGGAPTYTRATSPGNAIGNVLKKSVMSGIYPDDFGAAECDGPLDGEFCLVVAGGDIPESDE